MANTKRLTIEGAEEILNLYFPVLDYGFVALKDYMGGDLSIEEAARVSYGAGTRKVSETRGLIRYLCSHRHTTPFEMVELKFHVGMPIFVARQWVRHRTASLNEYSGRYSLMPMMFYTPSKDKLTTQSKSNKQGRSYDQLDEEVYDDYVEKWNNGRNLSASHYLDMCDNGVARELARMDLPLSTYTFWYWKIDLHNLFHFLGLRCDPHAQWEIRTYANKIAGMVKRLCPLAFEAIEDYRMYSSNFSAQEILLLQIMMSARFLEAKSLYDDINEELAEHAKELGMSKRETKAFFDKLKPKDRRDFDLDLSEAKDGSYFESLIQEHTP